VYFHSIDFVLGREKDRNAWRSCVHLPRTLFPDKNAKRKSKDNRKKDYMFFKRMMAVKEAVFTRHFHMLRMYEVYCGEAEEKL